MWFLGVWQRLPRPSLRQLGAVAVASLIANIGIVVTGGAVRLTDSGMGCPTVPRCTEDSLVPHPALGIHGYIEFGNRLLTFVVGAAAILLWLAAMRSRPRVPGVRRLATVVLFGVPAQAVVGGVTVLTHLNPYVVMGHFLVSMVLIVVSVWIVRLVTEARESGDPPRPGVSSRPTVPGPVRTLALATFVAGCATIYVGAIVTGTGPHAGDLKAKRTGLDLASVTQLHADLVFLLLGLTIGTLLAFRAVGAPVRAQRAAASLLAVELGQGLIGFVQYATNLPEVLVGLHMLGAAVTMACLGAVVLGTRERVPLPADTAAAGNGTDPSHSAASRIAIG